MLSGYVKMSVDAEFAAKIFTFTIDFKITMRERVGKKKLFERLLLQHKRWKLMEHGTTNTREGKKKLTACSEGTSTLVETLRLLFMILNNKKKKIEKKFLVSMENMLMNFPKK